MRRRWAACFLPVVCGVAFFCSGCLAKETPAKGWDAVPAGVVLTRNFMVPESPGESGYALVDAKYRLGSKAYARKPPEWWLRWIADAKVGDRWHPKDFPVAYAGEFKTAGGDSLLLVVQVSHAFSGDGYGARGPEVHLVARVFSPEKGRSLLREQSWRLGDFQYARLYAGELAGRAVLFRSETGTEFNGRKVTGRQDWLLNFGDDGACELRKLP